MKTLLRIVVVLAVLGGAGYAAWQPMQDYLKKAYRPKWRQVAVEKGDLKSYVNATGTVNPMRKVVVGSFVSGPIDTSVPLADFNQEVKAGDVLAKIDPRIYDANLKRDQATAVSRKADRDRAMALLEQSQRDLERAISLRSENKGFISQAEMDKLYFSVKTLKAQVEVADAAMIVASGQVDYSQTQLNYCMITAPESGIIINRKIQPGQTLAAQFQTPELFEIAPGMRERVDIEAKVDETDIGNIIKAQKAQAPVTFTVEAYSADLFTGVIDDVRMNSTTTQNVVTYPVIVAAKNEELKLLPGMTANLSFLVDSREDAVKIPNSALRFFPNAKHVRPEDRPILDGGVTKHVSADPDDDDPNAQAPTPEKSLSAGERSELRAKRSQRYVWVVDGEGDFLRAVPVTLGLNDNMFTEMLSGDLKPGDQLVVNLQVGAAAGGK